MIQKDKIYEKFKLTYLFKGESIMMKIGEKMMAEKRDKFCNKNESKSVLKKSTIWW